MHESQVYGFSLTKLNFAFQSQLPPTPGPAILILIAQELGVSLN